jgi:hypothetical protein
VPGGSFFPSGDRENYVRLNFSCMPKERITEGVRRLGEVVREALAGARGTGRPALALASSARATGAGCRVSGAGRAAV